VTLDLGLLRRAVFLEWVTMVWTIVAGALGTTFGTISRSVSLTAFGLDSIVELVCAYALLRRLNKELAGLTFGERDELRAARFVGALLLFAALYVSADALWSLVTHNQAKLSGLGIWLTIATIPVMFPLATAKSRIARSIKSRALLADAIGNAVCWYLAAIVLASLLIARFYPIWWLDGTASLLVAVILVAEGAKAWKGEALS